jgi:hypothetical protein
MSYTNTSPGGSYAFNPPSPRQGPTQFDPQTDVANQGDTRAYGAPSAPSLAPLSTPGTDDKRSRLLALLQSIGVNPADYGISAYAVGGMVGSGDLTTTSAPDITAGQPGTPGTTIPAAGSTNDLNLQLQQLIGRLSAPQVQAPMPVTPQSPMGGGGGPSGGAPGSDSASAASDSSSEGSPGSPGDSGDGSSSGDAGAGAGSAGSGSGAGGGSGGGDGSGGSYARGGLIALVGGGKVAQGPGGGLDDLIPTTINGRRAAALSDGEFVVPADVVSMMGDGSSNAGSRRLYDMVRSVRQNKTGSAKQAGPLPVGEIMKRVT